MDCHHIFLCFFLIFIKTRSSVAISDYTVFRGYNLAPFTNISTTSSTVENFADCLQKCDDQSSPACFAAEFDPLHSNCTLSACARVVLDEADGFYSTPAEQPRVFVKGVD